tara:strand:- start:3067 stop:5883 length:2817 start_codon:yes stop_codon:yes gene_type:complete
MVRITYSKDPSLGKVEQHDCSSLGVWLGDNFNDRDKLLDLAFFRQDILGERIETCDGEFLDIVDGEVFVTHKSALPEAVLVPYIWYIVVAVVVAVAVVALTPKPEVPNQAGTRKQQSSTNSLGDRENGLRINERIDDIFGSVAKHVPSLWQAPYRKGENNQEVEYLLLCIGRGGYLISDDTVYDGDTKIKTINGASFQGYGPYTHPGNGAPEIDIGPAITEDIGIYRQSNDLNPSELLPPNESDLGGADFVFSSSDGLTGTITATSYPGGFDFTDEYAVGEDITLKDVFLHENPSDITLYNNNVIPTSRLFTMFDLIDLNELSGATIDYPLSAVSTLTLTINLSALPVAVQNRWNGLSNSVPIKTFNTASGALTSSTQTSTNVGFSLGPVGGSVQFPGTWHTDPAYNNRVFFESISVIPVIGDASAFGFIGPLTIPDFSDKIILNFVSPNGFYKLSENNEVPIFATINVLIEELNSSGVGTGTEFNTSVQYRSDISNTRGPVFTTEEISIPYDYARVTCSRETLRDKGSKISNVDKIEWRDLYSFKAAGNLDFGDVTLAHVRIPSNSSSRLVKKRKINLDVTRKITEYTAGGNLGTPENFATDDFAQILIHMSLDPYIGRLTLDDINADGFLLLSQEIDAYFGDSQMSRFGYDFDTTKMTFQESFMLLCNVVNCLPYAHSGVYDAIFEKRQDVSFKQITHRNKIIDSESSKVKFHRRNDGVELTYRDELTAVNETIILPADGSAINPEEIEMPGCTTRIQALRRAHRIRNKQIYNTKEVTFDVDAFGRMIVPGQRIDSPDGTRFTKREGVTDGYRVYDGEVVEVNGLILELSQPVEFTDGENHFIQFTKENGDLSATVQCVAGDNEFLVVLQSAPNEAVYDGYQKDRTKYIFMSEQLQASVPLLPQTVEFAVTDGEETHTISSINYSHNYYDGDTETL